MELFKCNFCGFEGVKELFNRKGKCKTCNNKYKKERRHRIGENKVYKNRPGKDMTGVVFENFVVDSFSHMDKGAWWNIKCVCGVTKPVRQSTLKTRQSCGCLQHKNKKGNKNTLFKGVGKISATRLRLMQYRAEKRGLEFQIDLEFMWNLFLKQNGKCALSGIEIDFGETKGDKWTASLDRIDSTKGYLEDNVQWVHKEVNFMKQALTEERFLLLCKTIADYSTGNLPVGISIRDYE